MKSTALAALCNANRSTTYSALFSEVCAERWDVEMFKENLFEWDNFDKCNWDWKGGNEDEDIQKHFGDEMQLSGQNLGEETKSKLF